MRSISGGGPHQCGLRSNTSCWPGVHAVTRYGPLPMGWRPTSRTGYLATSAGSRTIAARSARARRRSGKGCRVTILTVRSSTASTPAIDTRAARLAAAVFGFEDALQVELHGLRGDGSARGEARAAPKPEGPADAVLGDAPRLREAVLDGEGGVELH